MKYAEQMHQTNDRIVVAKNIGTNYLDIAKQPSENELVFVQRIYVCKESTLPNHATNYATTYPL